MDGKTSSGLRELREQKSTGLQYTKIVVCDTPSMVLTYIWVFTHLLPTHAYDVSLHRVTVNKHHANLVHENWMRTLVLTSTCPSNQQQSMMHQRTNQW